jgi:hypothetical protein
MMSGLNTFSSKLPDAPPMPTATSFPQHLRAHHRHRFRLRRVHLAGHDRTAGSFSGIVISPRPERGPDASQRTSLAIFISATASVLQRAVQRDERLVSAERRELVRRRLERQPGELGDLLRARSAYSDAC